CATFLSLIIPMRTKSIVTIGAVACVTVGRDCIILRTSNRGRWITSAASATGAASSARRCWWRHWRTRTTERVSSVETISTDKLRIRRRVDTDVVGIGIKPVHWPFLLIIERNGQVMRRTALSIQRYRVLLSRMNVLAGFTDTDIRLHDREAVLAFQ